MNFHMDLPLVPFEFFLFSMLLCFAAGMVAAMLLFLFVFERKAKPREPRIPVWDPQEWR